MYGDLSDVTKFTSPFFIRHLESYLDVKNVESFQVESDWAYEIYDWDEEELATFDIVVKFKDGAMLNETFDLHKFLAYVDKEVA